MRILIMLQECRTDGGKNPIRLSSAYRQTYLFFVGRFLFRIGPACLATSASRCGVPTLLVPTTRAHRLPFVTNAAMIKRSLRQLLASPPLPFSVLSIIFLIFHYSHVTTIFHYVKKASEKDNFLKL